jgi:hypothetical protein
MENYSVYQLCKHFQITTEHQTLTTNTITINLCRDTNFLRVSQTKQKESTRTLHKSKTDLVSNSLQQHWMDAAIYHKLLPNNILNIGQESLYGYLVSVDTNCILTTYHIINRYKMDVALCIITLISTNFYCINLIPISSNLGLYNLNIRKPYDRTWGINLWNKKTMKKISSMFYI